MNGSMSVIPYTTWAHMPTSADATSASSQSADKRDGVDGLLFAIGQGRRGGQQRANGGGSGEDVKEAPSESVTGRVNHAEYLNSVVGGVATRS